MIKVLIIDDSALVRTMLTEILNSAADIEVVGTAPDPFIARDKIKSLNPDVLTLDIEMPRMDGITFLRNLMRLRPMPVVMISTLTAKGAAITLEALDIGALDCIEKPKTDVKHGLAEYEELIINKVRMAATAKVRPLEKLYPIPRKICRDKIGISHWDGYMIGIGASTGGTEAIKEILIDMPIDVPPILIAQHIPIEFSTSFANRLELTCDLRVYEAWHGQEIERGSVYLAPGDDHLTIKRIGNKFICQLDKGEKVNHHRPSVDVLFDSMAELCGQKMSAALLTGMGCDGANGLLNIRKAGGYTIAQDEDSSVVWGMPGSAVKLNAAYNVLPLNKMVPRIMADFSNRKRT